MTLPRVAALMKHWRQFPPTHISVAALVGAGKRDPGPVPKFEFPPEFED